MELSSSHGRRFTRDHFRRMIDAGIFDADEHVELLDGRFIVVPPQGPPHSYVSTILRDRLMQLYTDKLVREAKPLDCGTVHVPEPDLAVVHGSAKDFEDRDPRGDEALLVVEVSRTTQQLDRDKAAIYAEGGVPAYWLVDLPARRVEVHTGPADGRYRLVQVLSEPEELKLPGEGARWRVADLLPTP